MGNPKSIPYNTDFQHLLPCKKSPTRAHHWMLSGIGVEVQGPCKYCGTMSHPHKAVYGADSWEKQRATQYTIRKLVEQAKEK